MAGAQAGSSNSQGSLTESRTGPVIAVAVTVTILVVVAYFALVLLASTGSHAPVECSQVPCSLAMAAPTETTPAPGVAWASVAITPTRGLTTAVLELRLMSPGFSTDYAAGTAPVSTCKATVALQASSCGVPASGLWYVALVNGTTLEVLNVYSAGAWTGAATPLTVGLALVVVSATDSGLFGSGDHLSAYGTGGSSVSGSSPSL